MTRRAIVTLWIAGSVLGVPMGSWAEPHDLRVVPPERPSIQHTAPPGEEGRATRVPQRRVNEPPASYGPAFVAALTKQTETGQAGIAGWAVPEGPAVTAVPDSQGWLGLGLAAEWGGRSGLKRNRR
jgi:hypothetical protein